MNEESFRISGVSCAELANTIGTPIFIYDEGMIRAQLENYREHFVSSHFETKIFYASKAFLCGEMVRILKEEGICMDIASGGELYCAKANCFPMENIYFHGNNKSDEEIALALEFSVGGIVLDGEMECVRVLELAGALRRNVNVLIRINPGIEEYTCNMSAENQDSKFGISVYETQRLEEMIKKIQASKFVCFMGFYAPVGSRDFEISAFKDDIEKLMDFIEKIEDSGEITVEAIGFGGGYAACQTAERDPAVTEEICRTIIGACEGEVMRRKLHLKTLMIDPGRSIVSEAGYTLYRAGFGKRTAAGEFVFVDGGMSDNIRPVLYREKYNCDNISRIGEPKTEKVTIAGKCCESGDVLIENIMMPKTRPGDLLLMYTTGAYGYSMASNYKKIGRPPVVFVNQGRARCVVKRESYENLIALDCNKNIL